MSMFCSSRWVAKLCRRVCSETRLRPMLALSLRLTIINDRPLANDFAVFWTSESFGVRRVGCIRLASEQSWKRGEQWDG
jgi:hypothetical protein